ncbi:MAG: alpha/beta hydrolase [Candidatus Omnitrophota bacterium]|nr:alpha/beta hydrolase [Candidatus Omnitrophota bacterium]
MTLVEVVFLILFWGWVLSAILFLRNTVLPRIPIPELAAAATPLPLETVHFEATDGLRLEGWLARTDPLRPWLILCHGVGSNRADLLDIAEGLHAAGFNLLLFDFRGHGGSDGRTTSFGWTEQRDLKGALAFLGGQPEIPAAPYGVYGTSMGGVVALLVAARDERIGAVAVDSPYTNLGVSISRHLRLMYRLLPSIPFHGFVLSTYRLRFGSWPHDVSPERAATRLSPRALLMIQGGHDHRMPLEDAQRMFDGAGQPKELWVVDGADHLEGFALDPSAYRDRLSQFFHTNLSTVLSELPA